MLDKKSLFIAAPLDDFRKNLIFKVAGNDPRTFPLIHSLEKLRRRDQIYSWLIRERIVGDKLFQFFQERGFSWLRVSKEILKRIDRVDSGPLIAGRDVL